MLTIYRASAGAGKTHRLTGDYLKLLFAHPNAYRRILAVTFTNKATDEMKNRIIEELYALASGQFSPHIGDLCRQWKLTEEKLRQKANTTLRTILHDYSSFNISTIDRFFQQTMRAFTREIGLQGGYSLEMDRDLVLTEAVDNLLADLDKKENKVLLGWLLRFAEEKVEDGGSWNLRKDIMTLGQEVFKESFKLNSEQVSEDIADKEALEQYRKELFRLMQSVEKEVQRLGEMGLGLISRYGLTPDEFVNKGRSPFQLLKKWAAGEMKEPTATFMNLPDTVEKWYSRSDPPEVIQRITVAYNEGLNDCIAAIVRLFSNLTDYHTAKEISRYYYTLGILNDISAQIAAYREEKNVLLIADTTELLSKVIDGSDAPFVYEKTGTRIDHYMIDEFQDTSSMQWHNFHPLIRESLAYRQTNLIVGDVKQSIYRFRNSDWKLLDEQVASDFLPEQLEEKNLEENWRSSRLITAFNNAFFTVAPGLLQVVYNEALDASSLTEAEKAFFFSRIVSAYKQHYQQPAPPLREKDGHVRIEFLSREDEERPWKEEALDRLPGIVERLQDNGYSLRDIGILVRTNQEGAAVADKLLTHKEENPSDRYRYDLISDDALFVGSSPSVRLLIALLHYLKSPEDRTAQQMARFSFYALTGTFDADQADSLSAKKEELEALATLSLYEMAEGLCRLFGDHFPVNEQAFVQAFLDLVIEFSRKEGTDLGKFLKWWEESGVRKTIATPDGQDAIRILTIHKAKGLGMKVIIVPFGDWEIDHRPTQSVILWCRPQTAPFNTLRLVPVRYSRNLANTRFATDYFNERLYACIDNLNTLYVALTRAKEELIVFAPRPKKLTKSGEVEKIDSISSLLWAGLSTAEPHTREGQPLKDMPSTFDTEAGVFEWGDWWQTEKKTKESATEEILFDKLLSVSPEERLELRLHGKELFFDDSPRKHGALMHEILSRIRTAEDIPDSVERYRREGVINRQEAESLKVELERLLNKPEVYAWYHAPTRVLNEVEILSGSGKSRRPDRVMLSEGQAIVVDYKFGDIEDPAHLSQVRNYLRLIREMGYPEVKGYLWYVGLDVIKEVSR
ncbi:UvrD-helicase domain-containing protein [Parabacteroides sp. PF5-6]|uniref:UvrD-helicase domain-containing protein n=1 Tax=Parabacteroides sp. PF5-6 TaxID=1742403 RepID=UPI002406AEB5|nr:UvrD-helicase domain-containing protein [Parabacteroides sp. PF5-6]MDF9829980.1 ATP-dependent helicase/nuclease subunit A [Parabacteroides sp. PF5-6]